MRPIQRAAILGCSNAVVSNSTKIPMLCETLQQVFHIEAFVSPTIFQTRDGQTQSAQVRAEALMAAFCDTAVDIILDISGGDAANAILPFLDFECIRIHAKPFLDTATFPSY